MLSIKKHSINKQASLLILISFIRSYFRYPMQPILYPYLYCILIPLPIMPLITDGFNFSSNAYELIQTMYARTNRGESDLYY